MRGPKVRINAHRFRNSMLSQAYQQPAIFMQARVINVNMVNWTVDVISQFDRHYFSDIQVLSPYLHYDNGEGVYVMPEVGAVCMVCVPSDTTPPFVAGFVAPMEQRGGQQLQNPSDPNSAITTTVFGTQTIDPNQTTGKDAPAGTRSRGSNTVQFPNVDAAFSAGRPAVNPGDIVMRTRDDNFVVLHRGGVVSIGATELAQRIYIPLNDKILDVSGEYEHQNIGGSVHWGIQEGPKITNPGTQHMECYRIFANDQYADIRVAKGKVLNPIDEPTGAAGDQDDIANYSLGTDKDKGYICYEVAVAANQVSGQGGFRAVSGDPSDANVRNQTVMRFFFDIAGGMFLRAEGNAVFSFHKKLKIKVEDDFTVECKTLTILASEGAQIGGTDLTEVSGNLVKFAAGVGLPAARLGDAVTITMSGTTLTGTISCPAVGPSPQPCTIVIALAAPAPGGIITTGNTNIQM
jgi:hypothetical protein